MKTVIYPYLVCLALEFPDGATMHDKQRENLRGGLDGIKTVLPKTTRWTGIIHVLPKQ
ncbi:hypothetical protein CaCOL14_011340 [Colletotrichum acutatum]